MTKNISEDSIAKEVVDAAYRIHVDLGPGLLESAYETALAHSIQLRGLSVERQKPIPIHINGVSLDEGFRADLIVGDMVIVELKSVENMNPVFKKQLKTYLKLSGKRLGLLINFGTEFFRDGISRVVVGLPDGKKPV